MSLIPELGKKSRTLEIMRALKDLSKDEYYELQNDLQSIGLCIAFYPIRLKKFGKRKRRPKVFGNKPLCQFPLTFLKEHDLPPDAESIASHKRTMRALYKTFTKPKEGE